MILSYSFKRTLSRRLFNPIHYRPLTQSNRPKEYELRVGFAIATLQDDIPLFFSRGLTEHTIYSPHIKLSDPHYTKLSIHGRTAYLGIAQMLRWSSSMYFDDIQLEILKMKVLSEDDPLSMDEDMYGDTMFSSIHQAEDDLKSRGPVKRLEVRWKLEGSNHGHWLRPQPSTRHIEGVFVYHFDEDGYIDEHRIQRIVPPPSKRVVLLHSLGVRLRSLFWERPPVLNPGF
ncbi:hypothetical protein EDC96DRAFT_468029 [Choanephora cucurbitarum]|nr:hypothetical protein EDC96DRAFT_468029 [Choanephora cucurbitarum]